MSTKLPQIPNAPPPDSNDKPIIARPPAWKLYGGLFFVLLTATLLCLRFADIQAHPEKWTREVLNSLQPLLMFCLGIGWIVHAARYRAIATKDGLYLRDLKPWRWVPWSDITDYYETFSTENSNAKNQAVPRPRNTIETKSGETFTVPSEWTNILQWKMAVEERAFNATQALKANGTTGWAVKGARLPELPGTFPYDETQLKQARFGLYYMMPFVCALMLATPFLFRYLRVGSGYSPETLNATFLVCLIAFGFLNLLVLVLMIPAVKAMREGFRRLQAGEEIKADRDGLYITRNGDTQFVGWHSIIGYEVQTHFKNWGAAWQSVRVRTADGLEFTFTDRIKDYTVLLALLRHYAPDAVEYKQDESRKQAIGGVALCWTGGEEGKGDRVFHARTRKHRATLFSLWSLTLLQLFFVSFTFVPALLFIAVTVAVTLWYYRYRILVGAKGITRITPVSRQFVAWNEVVRWSAEGDDGIVEGPNGTLLRWNATQLAYGGDIAELVRENVERAKAKHAKEFPQASHADLQTLSASSPTVRQDGPTRTTHSITADESAIATVRQR